MVKDIYLLTYLLMLKERNHLFITYRGRVEDIINIKHGRTKLNGALNVPCILHWFGDDLEFKLNLHGGYATL